MVCGCQRCGQDLQEYLGDLRCRHTSSTGSKHTYYHDQLIRDCLSCSTCPALHLQHNDDILSSAVQLIDTLTVTCWIKERDTSLTWEPSVRDKRTNENREALWVEESKLPKACSLGVVTRSTYGSLHGTCEADWAIRKSPTSKMVLLSVHTRRTTPKPVDESGCLILTGCR